MKILTKKRKLLYNFYRNKKYSLLEALLFFKNNSIYNFNESIDISLNLSKNFLKDNPVKGYINLPYNLVKFNKIIFFIEKERIDLYSNLFLKNIGSFDLVEKILSGYLDFDLVISSPLFIKELYPIKDLLLKKNIFPSDINGTITYNVDKIIKKSTLGALKIKNDKNGIINSSIGKVNFPIEELKCNFYEFLNFFIKNKNFNFKYFLKIFLSSTMGFGLDIILDNIFNF